MEGYEINNAGYVIHSAIHAARDDVQCVMHTHTEDGMALSSLEEGLMFTNQETFMFWDNIGYHPFEGIADPSLLLAASALRGAEHAGSRPSLLPPMSPSVCGGPLIGLQRDGL